MMKLAFFLAAIAVAAARPQQSYGAPRPQNGNNGYGQPQQNGYQGNLQGAAQTQLESEAGMPYNFQWAVNAPEFGNDYSHQQQSDGRVTSGEYRVLLPDSRVQIVRFTADENGYVADVQYEGTAQYPQASNQVPVVAAYNGGQGQSNGGYQQQQSNGGYQQQQNGGYQQQQSNGGYQQQAQRPSSSYGSPGRR